MRVRILIAAAVVSSGWLGACSKPAADGARSVGTDQAAGRHILLPESSIPDGPVVSDLEAGRQTRTSRAPAPSVALTRGKRATPAVAAEAPVHEMVMTASSMAALRSVDLAPAPLAPAIPATAAVAEGHFLPGNDGDYPVPGIGGGVGSPRGPSIIIRGGMGSPDDDCDILNMRGHRGGIAVNRSAPAFGGSVSRGGGYHRGIR